MARPRKWNSEAERIAAYRAKKTMPATEVDPTLPVRDIERPEPSSSDRPVEVLLTLDPLTPLTDSEEQALRDHFGYTASERRTRAEREAAASRMLAPAPGPEVLAAIEQLRSEERRHLARTAAYRESLRRVP